jgi:hypothetical protein
MKINDFEKEMKHGVLEITIDSKLSEKDVVDRLNLLLQTAKNVD